VVADRTVMCDPRMVTQEARDEQFMALDDPHAHVPLLGKVGVDHESLVSSTLKT